MHRLRSTLARLRYQIELADPLSPEDRTALLSTTEDLLNLTQADD